MGRSYALFNVRREGLYRRQRPGSLPNVANKDSEVGESQEDEEDGLTPLS